MKKNNNNREFQSGFFLSLYFVESVAWKMVIQRQVSRCVAAAASKSRIAWEKR